MLTLVFKLISQIIIVFQNIILKLTSQFNVWNNYGVTELIKFQTKPKYALLRERKAVTEGKTW